MQQNSQRRDFLRLLGAGTLGAAAVACGQETHAAPPRRRFTGLSKKGDVAEALQNAIEAAGRSVRHPDSMVTWTLKEVTGRSGGIAGFHEVQVTIEARVS